jgi:hypothetical protein
MWIGLLFCMICLSTQCHQAPLSPQKTPNTQGHSRQGSQVIDSQATVDMYRERVVQCLLLGHYTKGGPYVVDTLILYFLVEVFHLKDVENGIWLLVGSIVQISIHMGYHRDAEHFPNISPFAGEMRRRVWAMILQIDSGISTQLGLPRLVNGHTDTAEPRNLKDSDFDKHTTKLPSSRPETEATDMLYVLGKLRVQAVGARIADVATEPRPHSYAEILQLHQEIEKARDALPPSLKWRGLASSLMASPKRIIQKIWLEMMIQQFKIVLHRKFLEPSRLHQQYSISRSACLNAAITILEFQHLVDEETQPGGLLYESRWRVSFAFVNNFLLATSILCFCLQNNTDHNEAANSNSEFSEIASAEKIRKVLEASQDVWRRQCATSKEAQNAVAALHYVLGDPKTEPQTSGNEIVNSFLANPTSYFSGES